MTERTMPRPLAEIIAHIWAVRDSLSADATQIQTEDLHALCDAAYKIERQAQEIERLREEIKRLHGVVDTCRELREFDQREINRLRQFMKGSIV